MDEDHSEAAKSPPSSLAPWPKNHMYVATRVALRSSDGRALVCPETFRGTLYASDSDRYTKKKAKNNAMVQNLWIAVRVFETLYILYCACHRRIGPVDTVLVLYSPKRFAQQWRQGHQPLCHRSPHMRSRAAGVMRSLVILENNSLGRR